MEDLFSRIFWGFTGIGIGLFLTLKSNWVVDTFGRIGDIERVLGSGKTYTIVRVLGVFIVFYALAHMLGVLDKFLGSVFGFLDVLNPN